MDLQSALESANLLLEGILSSTPDRVILYDPEGRFLFANQAARAFSLNGDREVRGQTWREIGLPEQIGQSFEARLAQIVQSRTAIRAEEILESPQGKPQHLETILSPVFGEAGKIVAILNIVRDITERKSAEEELRRSEEKFERVFRLTPDAMAVNRIADGTYLDANDAFLRITGYTRDELLHHSSLELGLWVDPAQRAQLVAGIHQNQEVHGLEAVFRKKDGSLITGLMSARTVRIGEESCILSVTTDITERKRMERELRESELRFRQLFEQAADGIFQGAPDGAVISVNPKGCELTGFPPEEILGKNLSSLFSSEELKRVRFRYDLLDKGETVVSERVITRRDGTSLPIEMNTRRMGDGTYLSFFRDISSRLEAEKKLRHEEALLASIIDSNPFAIQLVDAEGHPIRHNQAFLNLFGIAAPPEYSVFEDPILEAAGFIPMLRECLQGRRVFLPDHWYDAHEIAPEAPSRRHCLRVTVFPLFGPDGVAQNLVIMHEDITGWKQAEEALRRQEEQYRSLFFTMAQGVVYQDSEGRVISANPSAERILGLSLDQITGRTAMDSRWECIHEDGTPFLGEEYPAMVALHTGKPVQGEVMGIFQAAEGHHRWAVVDATPEFLSGQEKPSRVFTTLTDITELRSTQEAKRKAAQRLQEVVNNSQAVIFQLDPEGRFLLSEGRELTILGLRPGQVVGLSALEMYRDSPSTLTALKKALAGEAGRAALEVRGLVFDTNLSPVFDEEGRLESVIGVSTNITERVKIEKALRVSQRKFARLFDLTPDLLGLLRMSDGSFLDVNQGFEKATGYSRQETLGRTAKEIQLWNDPGDRMRLIQKLREQSECHGLEFVLKRKDGSLFHALVSANIFEIDGESYALVIAGDITERVRNEASLRESEQKFRDLIGKLGEGFGLADAQGTFTFVNPAAESIFGVGEGQLVGRNLREFLGAEEFQSITGRSADRKAGEKDSYELTVRRPNQELRRILVNLTPLLSPEGTYLGANGLFQDITERHQAEEALRQAQKLESLGVLAGGIAHDFNNLLTAILGNLNLAQTVLPGDSAALPYLESMEKTVLRAADLTKQMLAYSGRGRFVVKLHDLNHMVQETTHLLQVSIPKKTSLRFRLAPGVLSIEADAAQIHQVVMNLVTNASDAIGESEGTISVATQVESHPQGEIPAASPGQTLPAGTYAVLEVSDSGCGMEPEVLGRIFDPFYSTKASGRGLGLSAMLGILRAHKAGVRIQSQVGRGSTFSIYFPLASSDPVNPVQREAKMGTHFAGEALIVDDEPMVLDFTSQAMTLLGFKTTPARDGQEAVEIFSREPNRFDLVLLDLTMPRMDGREALREIRRVRPDVPIILSSGYSDQELLTDLAAHERLLFLQKPYQLKNLKETLQNLLRQPEE